jgi:hypothetical protein
MLNEIDRWIDSGAEVQEGLRLLSIYAPNRHLDTLVRKAPKRFSYLLKASLLPFSSKRSIVVSALQPAPKVKFRESWPFLSEPDCPQELKILAADKITAWEESMRAHEELFLCTTPEQCYETAKKVLENYSNNRKIFSEFTHYKEHHSVLGEHPIFKESRQTAELRAMPIMELVRKKENLEEAIWRAGNEIKKGDKPHLRPLREERIAAKRRMLAEVKRMIDDYEQRRERRQP